MDSTILTAKASCVQSIIILSATVILLTFRRLIITNGEITSTNDGFSQVFMAIKAYFQESVMPEKDSLNGKVVGRYNYPVGYYWIMHRINRFLPFQKIKTMYSISDYFSKINPNCSSEINTTLTNITIFSTLLFPLIAESVFCIVSIYSIKLWFQLILIVIGLLYIDACFPLKDYAISTRSIGYLLFFLFSMSLYINLDNYTTESIRDFAPNLLTTIIKLIVLYLVPALCIAYSLISSQRSIQCILVLSILVVVFDHRLALYIIIVVTSAYFYCIQFNSYNINEILSIHFLNKFRERLWRRRTYGNFRYSLISKITYSRFLIYLRDCATLKLFRDHLGPSCIVDKNFAVFSLFSNRIYLYSVLLMFFWYNTNINTILALKIFLAAGLLPFLLCNFEPFQGYGPGGLYMPAFAPFLILSLANSLNIVNITSDNHAILVLLTIMAFDYTTNIIYYIYRYTFDVFGHCKNCLGANYSLSLMADKFLNPYFAATLQIDLINLSSKLESISNIIQKKDATLSIITLEHHSQPYLELLSDLPFIYDFDKKTGIKPAYQMIDNIGTGYYDDLDGFSFRKSIIPQLRPDLVLLDKTKSTSKPYFAYIEKFSRNNGIKIKLIFAGDIFVLIHLLY